MLTISADLSELSQVQREALSGFILSYPEIERRSAVPMMALPADVERRAAFKELTPEQAFAADGPAYADVGQPNPSVTGAPAATGLDKSGLPWDERIHSSSKALTADGNWRKKRGVDDGQVALVEGQLKQLMSMPSPAAAVPPPPPPVASVPPPPPPSGPTLVSVPDEAARASFIKLVGHVSESMQDKKIAKEEVQAILDKYAIPTLSQLMSRTDLIPAVAMDIEAIIISR